MRYFPQCPMLSTKLKYFIFEHPNLNTMPSLNFSNVSEIELIASDTDIRIYVNSQLLGAINVNTAVTLYVQTNGSQKSLVLQPINNNQYNQGNTGSNQDTIYFNQKRKNANPRIQICSSNNNIYKLTGIGWQEDSTGQSCTGGGEDAFTHVFNISSGMMLKAKMENFTHNGETSIWMVARYGYNTMVQEQEATAMAYTGGYCYYNN